MDAHEGRGKGGSWHAAQIKERLKTEPRAIVIIIEITPIATHTTLKR